VLKKSGKGKNIKVESSARYLPLNENYEIHDPLKGGVTYKRQLIRLLWRCSIYNTEGCKKFDPEWYADALTISQKLNRHASNGALVKKKFDVDCELPN